MWSKEALNQRPWHVDILAMTVAYLVSLLLGEDPVDQDDDGFGFTRESYPRSKPMADRTGGRPRVPSTGQRVSVGYAFGALGLLLAIVVAFALPTYILSPCPWGLDCSRHLNMVKLALILPGLLVAFIGLLVGAFQAFRAQC